MGVIHSNHCVYDAHYHLVFPVKYRKALLEPHISRAIQDIAKEIEERYDITFEKLGTDGNHIHILCSFHPKYSGSQIVGMFKRSSSPRGVILSISWPRNSTRSFGATPR